MQNHAQGLLSLGKGLTPLLLVFYVLWVFRNRQHFVPKRKRTGEKVISKLFALRTIVFDQTSGRIIMHYQVCVTTKLW